MNTLIMEFRENLKTCRVNCEAEFAVAYGNRRADLRLCVNDVIARNNRLVINSIRRGLVQDLVTIENKRLIPTRTGQDAAK